MFCKNCGAQLQEDMKFCPNCGTAVELHKEGAELSRQDGGEPALELQKPKRILRTWQKWLIIIVGVTVMVVCIATMMKMSLNLSSGNYRGGTETSGITTSQPHAGTQQGGIVQGQSAGNTSANQQNWGVATSEGEYKYFADANHIYRIALDEPDLTFADCLYTGTTYDSLSTPYLNVSGNSLYFCTTDGEGGSAILRLDLDSGEIETIVQGDDQNRVNQPLLYDGILYYLSRGETSPTTKQYVFYRVDPVQKVSEKLGEFSEENDIPKLIGVRDGKLFYWVDGGTSLSGAQISAIDLDTGNERSIFSEDQLRQIAEQYGIRGGLQGAMLS